MSSEDIRREFVSETMEMAVARLEDQDGRMAGLRDRMILDIVSGRAVLELRRSWEATTYHELMECIEHNEVILLELEGVERTLNERGAP